MSNFSKLLDGSALTVGTHDVTVLKYLSEGGFAHIYKVQVDPPHDGSDIACLKRVIVPNKAGLHQMRKEVDVMKSLRDARNIVRYYDSHAERLEDGSYQVLVLMELCPNGSLLDYMNEKIRTKLAEPEILKIMLDIAIGIYEMHKLKMIHRDIKIENVLIDANGDFELCDFGSTSPPLMPAQDQTQLQALSHDILYQTTPQYRLPEMVDLYRGLPIDEKSDIWAFGCFLYKLCFYTTPFEANGEIAILHASFQFPPLPVFSGDLNNLIIIMLQENPAFRPNIFQVIVLLAKLMAKDPELLEISDIYHQGEYNFLALSEYQQHRQKTLAEQQEYALKNLRVPSGYPDQAPVSQADIEGVSPSQSRPVLRGTAEMTGDVGPQAILEAHATSDSGSGLSDLSSGLPDLENIENIAERYPSLENIMVDEPAFDIKTTDVSSKTNKDPEPHTGAALAALPTPTTHQIPEAALTEYTNTEPWKKPPAGPITEAELLADDIFSTYPSSSIPKVKSTHSMHASTAETTQQSNVRTGPKSAPLTTRIDPSGGLYEVSLLDINNDESLVRAKSTKSTTSAHSLTPSLHDEPGPVQPAQKQIMVSSVPQSGVPLPVPHAAAPDFAPPPLIRPPQPLPFSDPLRKDANPWGNYRRPGQSPSQGPLIQEKIALVEPQPLSLLSLTSHNAKAPHTATFIPQPEPAPKPQDIVADSLASLHLNSHPEPTRQSAPFLEVSNLIDLDSGDTLRHNPKTRTSTSAQPEKPPHSRKNLSTYGAPATLKGSDVEPNINDPKSAKKKRISSLQNVSPLNFQEETIDFASDDESPENQSRMSRMSIRKSLKLSRKSSELKRSESTHSDHRKRHSLFGGSSNA